MTTKVNSFEGGTDETTITAGNSGGASGDAFDSDLLTAVFDNARAAHGSFSCRCSVAGTSSAYVSYATSGTTTYVRAYVYLTAAPPLNLQLINPMSGSTLRMMIRIMTDRTVQITDSGFTSRGQSTTVLATGQWYRIEAAITQGTTTAGLVTLRIYSSLDSTTITEAVTATAMTIAAWDRVRFGANFSSTTTYDLWLDDVGVDDTTWLGPALTVTGQAGTDAGTLTEGAPSLSATASGTDAGAVTETSAVSATAVGTDTATLAETAAVQTGRLDWSIAVDWSGDGDFDDPEDDVTGRTLERGSFTAEFGRDQTRSLSPMASGRASLEIDNRSRDYSPDNEASPLYGQVLPARPLRIQGTQFGETYTLFRGHTDDYEIQPGRGDRSVAITGLDPVAKLQGAKATTQLYRGIRTGTAIGYVLDAIGWPAELRDLDPGATVIRWWWEEDADAFEAVQKIVNSEGPGAIVHADTAGRIVFRDRHHRLLTAASTTAQATLADDTEPAFSDFTYDHGWRDVINAVALKVDEYDPAPNPEAVWEDASVRSIAPSGTLELRVTLDNPVIAPALAYTVHSGSTSSSLGQTSGQTITITITAGVGGATLSQMSVLAQPVTSQRQFDVLAEEPSSIDRYGRRDYTHDAPWVGVHDAAAIGDLIIGARAERQPIVTLTVKSKTKTPTLRLAQQLARDLSDRVHVREFETGVDHDFFVERIKHTAKNAGLLLETEFGMERAAVQAANVFRFNDSSHGFNDGVFAATGLDDPANLLIFDVAGHGFNDGVFAT